MQTHSVERRRRARKLLIRSQCHASSWVAKTGKISTISDSGNVNNLWNIQTNVDCLYSRFFFFAFEIPSIEILLATIIYSLHVIRLGHFAKKSSALKLATSKATVEAILNTVLVLGLTTEFDGNLLCVSDNSAKNIVRKFFLETGCNIKMFFLKFF